MPKEFRSADELVKRLLSNPEVWARAQKDPATELLKLAQEVGDDMPATPALEADKMIYRMVVAIIGTVAVLAVIGATLVVVFDVTDATALLTALVSISSASIGALAGLLSPMSYRR